MPAAMSTPCPQTPAVPYAQVPLSQRGLPRVRGEMRQGRAPTVHLEPNTRPRLFPMTRRWEGVHSRGDDQWPPTGERALGGYFTYKNKANQIATFAW